MDKVKRSLWLSSICISLAFGTVHAQIPAFPGAEGFGSTTPGGRGGTVIEVTNLNGSGSGSFRDACLATGPRIVVFRVSGTIELGTSLTIANPYLTIAGQTAPGEGICLKGNEFIVGTHDVVIRGLRMRLGDQSGNKDAFRISGSKATVNNIVIDHCSISWGMDENASVITLSSDVTFSWNIISEALMANDNSFGFLLGKDGPTKITLHHNLFAHNRSRSAKIGRDVTAEIINNIVYDYGTKGTTASPGTKANIIGNYYMPGASTTGGLSSPVKGIDIQLQGPGGQSGTDPLLYVQGNIGPGRETNAGDDWGVVNGDKRYQSLQPAVEPSGVSITPVEELFDLVLDNAGVVSPARDAVDKRVVADVRNGTGKVILSQNEVGGWPALAGGTAPTDSDHDGMPDSWELANGLNPGDAADRNGDLDSDGYTNIEEYINSLIPDTSPVTSIQSPQGEVPQGFILEPNYPNPFNPSTTIRYQIPQSSLVQLVIFNSKGQVVQSLVRGFQNAGNYSATWDGTDASGRRVSSGLYFYELRAQSTKQVRKMLLIK